MSSFWNTIVFCLKVSGPLVRVLRLVDGEKRPPMGYNYAGMKKAKEIIVKSFNGNEESIRKSRKSLIEGGRFNFIGLCIQLGIF